MRQQTAASPHAVLDYVISRALLEGRTGRTVIKIPLADLVNDGEGVSIKDLPVEVVLKIELKTSWDEGVEDMVDEFINEDGDEYDTES